MKFQIKVIDSEDTAIVIDDIWDDDPVMAKIKLLTRVSHLINDYIEGTDNHITIKSVE